MSTSSRVYLHCLRLISFQIDVFFGWRRGFGEVLISLCYVLIWYWYGLKMATSCKLQSVRAYLIQYLDRALMCPLCKRLVLRGKNQNGTNHCFHTRTQHTLTYTTKIQFGCISMRQLTIFWVLNNTSPSLLSLLQQVIWSNK